MTTNQLGQQDTPQITGTSGNPFTVPTPQQVKSDPPESRMLIGLVIIAALVVATILPNHSPAPSQTTKAPTGTVATTDH